MPPISTNDIRQSYLDFFADRGHTVIPGASLIPENDPTVLFTTAGMHPLVPYLLGEAHPGGTRLVDVQRCIRTQDIDEVGDISHLTCFEMLGNWSLGDYFKKEAIEMSYSFLTDVLEIPHEHLAVTCFEGDADAPKDEEAAEIWRSVGMTDDRIAFLPKSENWWGPAGLTGPCGPDSEMFYWVGEGDPIGNAGSHPDLWMEIWNDVFMQYNASTSSAQVTTFEPLKQQNVDTGMGLERTAMVMQGVSNVYDIDSVKAIFDTVISIASADSSDETLRHTRIVTDHLKAAVFIIADGITPSNVDQGYVLRKLIRRAIRSARALGIEEQHFTSVIAASVIGQYKDAYSHIGSQTDTITAALTQEEDQFAKTLRDGTKHLQKVLDATEQGGQIAGQTAFHLYDTYGFPLELTTEIAGESGFTVDTKGFEAAFSKHQEASRAGAEQKFSGGLADHSGETTKLHTATHLLNAALRQVLGDHVSQRGSNITADRLRFDFNHDEKMTPEQKKEVEDIVKAAIEADFPVYFEVMTPDQAKEQNAIGVFDDRYGDEVKVYTIGDDTTVVSKEICGGPHVARTGMLGSFKLKKEESSSAGVRRIKATVSGGPEEIEVAAERATL